MKRMETGISKKYSCQKLINLFNSLEPTQQGLAVEYAKIGWPVFPCDSNKVPIVDPSLGFVHGHKDAMTIPKFIAKTWHKYPNAAIGFAIPPDIEIIDCDVRKDAEKRPIIRDGKPEIIGLESLNGLARKLSLNDMDFATLTTKTQSGGCQIFYRMPKGVPSFCRTHALEGLDLKGYGGYVILPNSQGQYGKYEFLNLTEIQPIPEGLLKWILQFWEQKGEFKKLPTGTAMIDREEIVRVLVPYWAKADGKRNDFTLAISGFIARSGGSEQDALYVISKLCKLAGRGYDHIPGTRYAFHREGKIRGLPSIKQIMEEINNAEK